MVRKHSKARKDAVERNDETPIFALGDEELVAVCGASTLLTSSVSSVLKAIGEGMTAMARKG